MSWPTCITGVSNSSSLFLVAADASKLLNRPRKHFNPGLKPNTDLFKSRKSKVLAYYGLRSPPYKLDALEPYLSQRTLEMHWGEHHRNYVDALNKQLQKNDKLYGCTLDELITVTYNNGSPLPEFNNAAQLWNHEFFWESMQPGGGTLPILGLFQQIEKDFGSFANFREKFTEAALTIFGSGWVWLVLKREEKRLAILKTTNAVNPLVWNDIPIINLDMWELCLHHYHSLFTRIVNSSTKPT